MHGREVREAFSVLYSNICGTPEPGTREAKVRNWTSLATTPRLVRCVPFIRLIDFKPRE